MDGPDQMYNFLCFSFGNEGTGCFFPLLFPLSFLFPLSGGVWGKEKGTPY